MSEFETFGFNIKEQGGKETLDILDSIYNRLVEIKKLQDGGIGGSNTTKSTTNNTGKPKKDGKSIEARIEREIKKQKELQTLQYKRLAILQESNKHEDKQIRLNARMALGLEDLESKQDNANNSLMKYGLRLTTVIALARKFAQFTSEAVKESASYVENLNLFAVTFGDTYKENAQWALDLANNLGLASSEAIRFTGLFKQLSTAIGNASETGTQMSRVLTQFGYDLASFYNIDVTSAMEKLQAGIYSGQTKPLRTIGIDVTYQSIDNLLETNKALAQFNTSSKQLDQSQKAIARTIIALQSGANAYGDMERTIDSLANQIRVFESSLINFKLAMGDLVEEPMRQALIYMNGFMQGITQVIRAFKPLKTDVKDNMIATLGADAEETNEALDETQKRLAGFDKFNVLKSGSSTSDIDITNALTAELQKQIDIYEEQRAQIEETASKVAEFAKKVRDFFIVVDEEGNFVDWTDNAKALAAALGVVATALTISLIGSGAQKLISGIASLVKAFSGLHTIIAAVGGVLAFLLTDNLLGLLGEDARKIVSPILLATSACTGLVVALLTLRGVISKGIGLTAIVASIGVAVASLKSIMKDTEGFANGGFSNANLIMTHENGIKEWVGKQGSSSAVVNDSQMSDIMQMAVARGVYEANMASQANQTSGGVIHNHIYLDGKQIYENVTDTAKRYGKKWSNV